jgi:response regulator RpfG family c-di-GMP phosphodiesterase
MTEDSAAVFTKVLGEVDRTGKSVNTLECDLTIHDGYRRIVEISVSAIIDANQKSTGFRGIVRDITEKKMLERQVLESLEDVKEARAGVILGLAKLAEYRDKDTGRHLERIREYAKLLAGEIAKKDQYREYITPEYIEDLYNSSILHDIGKVGIADAILLKPGRLTPEEYEIIKNHSILGGKTLSAVYDQIKGNSFLTIGMEIAYHHHEKWDGSGYPSGLKGKEIPLSARIVSIADVYDALVSKRCYKEAYTHEKSRDIIVSEKGRAFEPMLVDTFLVQEQEFKRIHIEMREDD